MRDQLEVLAGTEVLHAMAKAGIRDREIRLEVL